MCLYVPVLCAPSTLLCIFQRLVLGLLVLWAMHSPLYTPYFCCRFQYAYPLHYTFPLVFRHMFPLNMPRDIGKPITIEMIKCLWWLCGGPRNATWFYERTCFAFIHPTSLPFPARFAIRCAVRSPTHHPVHCYSISRCGSSHAFFRPLHRAISLSHFQCIYCRSPCLFSSDTPCVHWRIVKLSSVPRAFLVHSGAVRFAFPSPVRSDIRSPCVLLWFPSGFPPT